MADAIPAQTEPSAPAIPPAPAISPEMETLIAQRVQALSDQRIAGLQSAFDKKIAETNREMQKVRRQALGEPEDDPQDSDASREVAELKRQLAVANAIQRYPKAGPLYQALMGLTDVDEQLAYLEQQYAAPAPTPPPPPPAPVTDDVDVPDIDMNRPAPTAGSGYAVYDGVQMNDEIAAAIFKNVTSWPRNT